jgi:hypothetical protein
MKSGAQVMVAKRLQSGDIAVIGDFIHVNGIERRFMLRLAPDMTLRPDAWAFDTVPGVISEDAAGNCYLGNAFAIAPSISSSSVLKLTGCGPIDPNYNNATTKLVSAIMAGGDALFVATCDPGHLLYEPSCQLERFALEGAGVVAAQWSKVTDGQIHTIAPAADALYVGGAFTSFDGLARPGIVRLADAVSGTPDPLWSAAMRPQETFKIVPLSGGELMMSGRNGNGPQIAPLVRIGAQSGQWVADWEPTRTDEQMMGTAFSEIGDIEVQDDGSVLANGLQYSCCLKRAPLRGAITEFDDDFQVPVDRGISEIEYLGNDQALIVGSFRSVMGQTRHGIARISGTHRWIFHDTFE